MAPIDYETHISHAHHLRAQAIIEFNNGLFGALQRVYRRLLGQRFARGMSYAPRSAGC